jgi:glutamate-5-semialdehyde dehydrogenase
METTSAISTLAVQAKSACRHLAGLGTERKNAVLEAIARALDANRARIIEANARDLAAARQAQLAAPLLKRLNFDSAKLDEVLAGVKSVIALPDPVGTVLSARELDKGLELYQVSCPIGLIAMIFESRPDALVQIASLAVKSGNCLILKGGSEARESNRVLADTIHDAGVAAGLPRHWLVLAESRADVAELLKLHGTVDLIIPRGSNEFVQYIMRNSLIPVMGHADGICHVYLDATADAAIAEKVAVDSKTQYVAVCNAAETLLVHAAAAPELLPGIARALAGRKVELRACERSAAILADAGVACAPAAESDWDTEYLDYIISIKLVDSLEEAVEHINRHGSHHTDCIVSADASAARTFMQEVDSAGVYWNASTRFADGFKYGLGAEVGIATGKLHARGPVGLEGLVTYKYKLFGNGQIAADYATGGSKSFTHKNLDSRQEPWE